MTKDMISTGISHGVYPVLPLALPLGLLRLSRL